MIQPDLRPRLRGNQVHVNGIDLVKAYGDLYEAYLRLALRKAEPRPRFVFKASKTLLIALGALTLLVLGAAVFLSEGGYYGR